VFYVTRQPIVLSLALLSGGCVAAPAVPAASPYVACATPRPQVCTREYRPVCAQVDSGKRCVTVPCDSAVSQTRGNACDACADPKVVGYTPGGCADAKPR
jgi:hypothetical protein